jgi:hypothetical protein
MFKKLTLMAALLGSVSLTAMAMDGVTRGGGFDLETGLPTSFSNRPVEQVIPETPAQDTAAVPAPAPAAAPAAVPAPEAAAFLPAAPAPAPALVSPVARSVASFLELLCGGRPGGDEDGTRPAATSAAPTAGSTAAASDVQETPVRETYLVSFEKLTLAIPSSEYPAFKATLTRYLREAERIQQSLAMLSLLRSLSGLAHASVPAPVDAGQEDYDDDDMPPLVHGEESTPVAPAPADAGSASAPVEAAEAPAPAPAPVADDATTATATEAVAQVAEDEEECARSASPTRQSRSASMAPQYAIGDGDEEGDDDYMPALEAVPAHESGPVVIAPVAEDAAAANRKALYEAFKADIG